MARTTGVPTAEHHREKALTILGAADGYPVLAPARVPLLLEALVEATLALSAPKPPARRKSTVTREEAPA